jgi:hypothetical protein
VDEWRNAQIYEAADAQDIMRQLESTGQIRSGPTPLQKMWSDLVRSIQRGITNLSKASSAGWETTRRPAPAERPTSINAGFRFSFTRRCCRCWPC